MLIQLPEPTTQDVYPTIAEISKERVRRVIRELQENGAGELDLNDGTDSDRGFKVFKLAESNFTPWDSEAPTDAESLAKQLELHIHHIRDGRTEQDILFELLLKSGFPLTTPVEKLSLPLTPTLSQGERVTSRTVYSVANGAMLICLKRELTLELIRAMADKQPERVVCLDEGFAGNDQLKANAVQIFKTKGSPHDHRGKVAAQGFGGCHGTGGSTPPGADGRLGTGPPASRSQPHCTTGVTTMFFIDVVAVTPMDGHRLELTFDANQQFQLDAVPP